MDRNRWNRSPWAVWGIFLILCVLPTDSDPKEPYSAQPRIVVQNGNILIKSATDHNVSLKASGQGVVRVNEMDLTSTLPLMSNFINSHIRNNEYARSHISSLETEFEVLRTQFTSISNMASQLNQLEENVTAVTNQMNAAFGGTSRASIINFRRVVHKVRQLDDQVRELTELLSKNECLSNPCRNGGTCVDTYNGFLCQCTSAWEGVTCESDVNECALYAGTSFGCQNGASCQNTPGSFSCHCAPNFYGFHCAERHDDCTSSSHEELCVHGTCINEDRISPGQPKYRCICHPGWQKGSYGPACTQDINECADGSHRCSVNPPVQCINLPGTFHCGPCPAGFSGDGRSCYDINECIVHNGGCSMNPYVPCINTVGSRNCGPCPPGFMGDGVSCTFAGLCSSNNGGCHPLATCIQNTAISGSFRECRCPAGYVGNGEGLLGCTPGSSGSSCASNPCHNGNCQVAGNSFHCICHPGYTGVLCDQQINPCLSNPCQNGGTCVSMLNGFTCTCTSEFQGETCSEVAQSCGGNIEENQGSLSFPAVHGDHYEHGMDCSWVISVTHEKVLNISFPRFHLEGGYGCNYDFVEIHDGPHATSPLLVRLCGDEGLSRHIVSNQNAIHLRFRSDHSVSATGFTLEWNATNPLCGSELEVATHGAVNSPGYPNNYPPNRDCYWLVRVNRGQRIQFQFATLQLEHHDNCSFDYLRILDGASESDPELQKFCSTTTPPPVISSGANALLHFHSDGSVSDTGFHITYAAIPGIPGCGGLLTTPSGSFSSPNFPDAYDHLLRCEWLIRIHPDDRIELKFTDFSLEQHASCGFDYVAVYDGDSDRGDLLGRYCGGSEPPPKIMSNTNNLLIKLHTDYSVAYGGFRATYSTVCGGLFTSLQGSFHSPYYPDYYPASATCYYQIRLPPGNIIRLDFVFFGIESHYNCAYDYLEVRDGPSENSTSVGKLCGYSLPDSITSTYNELWLAFVTDGSVQSRGFYVNYTNIAIGCGGVLTNSSGFFGTPSHQALYPPSVTCNWLLRAPPGFIVRLSFDSFALEYHADCDYDYVLVQDSDGVTIGKYCGFSLPPTVLSLNNEMLVTFVADYSVSHEGFNASYTFLDSTRACGGDYYRESGVIRSPRYPQNYPHSKDCIWVLHAPNGRQFQLNVTDFKLEQHDNCQFDYLEIRNGGYMTSPLIGKYCGETITTSITSHSNTLRLEFHSDSSMSAPGFEIFYDATTTGCGGTITSPRSHIVSPNYPNSYGHNAECTWLIRVSEGSAISVHIVDIDIEGHQTCNYDFLQIYDGSSDSAPTLSRLCNGQQPPDYLRSRGNTLYIKFRTDVSDSGRGFHLAYNTLCNNTLKKHRGIIESPNFPNTYPHNHNCSWTIQAPLGNNITLSFSHLFMENATSCEADYVEVSEVPESGIPTQLAKYCGTPFPLPLPIQTTTNTAVVRLVTDASVTREGFRLEYAVKGCGGELRKFYGVISSPNYPHGYPVKTVCEWHIILPPDKRVTFKVEDLDLEGAEGCVYDYLKVYAGEDETSPLLLNECHKRTEELIVNSHGNHMFVKFVSDYVVEGKGFQAFYGAAYSECGGYFTAEQSVILSANYPHNYNVNDDCEWLIRVDPLHIVELEFYEFQVPTSTNCTFSYVAVYDGENTGMPLLLKHCGEKPNNPVVLSTSNTMLIRLKADGESSGKGFKAHYKTGCGQRFLADDGGEIKSPNYPYGSITIRNCSWILYASDLGERITLIITHLNFMDSENCETSSLEIRDGDQSDSPLIQRICGNHAPPHITSEGSIMHIFLHSHGTFRATYMASSSHCGGTYTSISGSFASPEYPNNYPVNTECVWILSASAGNKIMVSFSIFDMEDSDYCNMDYIELRETSESGRLIGRYCGSQIPNNITAANKVWIKFRSDEIGASPGFLAHYGLVHDSDLNGTSGVIESPGYPLPSHGYGTYLWTVTVPNNRYVSISFQDINIPRLHSYECSDAVRIYDGATTEALRLGDFCGYQIPDPVVSHGSQVTVEFETKGYVSSFWKLHWNAVSSSGILPEPEAGSACVKEINLNVSEPTEILSPNYPDFYESNYNCTWMLQAPPGNHIKLNFTHFITEGYQYQCYDTVEIYFLPNVYVDSWSLNSTLCGRKNNTAVVSPNNFMKMIFATNSWSNYPGFNGTAQTLCGGSLGGTSGMLNSSEFAPYFNVRYMYRQFNCEWVIQVRPRRTIQISFDSFNIPRDSVTATCSGKYLLLLNGGHETSPFLGRYCGNEIPAPIESHSNQIFVKLFMNSFQRGSPRFVLRYAELSAGCGGQIFITSTNDATFMTPNYPNPPPHDMICDWVVMSSQGSRILVEFDTAEFQFTGSCYEGEDMEYVQLFDGGTEMSEPITRYCAHSHATSPMSTGNVMLIRYFTAVPHPHAGIKVRVREASCGGTITAAYAEIESPGYPENYENEVECEWMIKMRFPWSYYLEFTDLETPLATTCSLTDYIEVRNNDKDGELIGTYCGNLNNRSGIINLPGLNTYIKFRANGRETGKGFHMVLHTEYYSGCGGYLNEPSGVITSPLYPAGSSAQHYCYWRIEGPLWRRVTATFNHFNLHKDEETGSCINKLLIYNGTYRDPGLELCGNELPDPIDSSSNVLVVRFINNGWAPGEGFSLSYSTEKEALCGGQLPVPTGVVTVPPPNITAGSPVEITCKWKLSTPLQNQTTSFRFSALDLPGNRSSHCRSDILYFWGSFSYSSVYLAYFCGNMTSRLPSFTTPTQDTTIELHSNLLTPFHGFNMAYNITDCGGEIDGYNATITSPGYPNNYSVNTICHWIFRVPYGDAIKVTITDLRMEANCDNDFLLISTSAMVGSPVLGKFCGTYLPEPIPVDGYYVSVRFQTDAYGTAPGFRLTTADVQRGCGGLIHRPQGTISSPEFPAQYPNNIECEWVIEYTLGSIVNLTFVGRFDIEQSANCENDYLMIEDYDEGQWILKEKKCGRQQPDNILSSSTKMRVTFHTNSQITGNGFQINYFAACGGHFTDPEGTIRSPNYPDMYLNSLYCQYIFGETGHYVNLEFEEDFDLEFHSDCSYDYIALYRGNSSDSPIIGKYCGPGAPSPATVLGQLLMEFVTDYSVVRHGFVAHYEITECGGNFTAPYGIIKSPKHSYQNLDYMSCAWYIFAPENRAISLRLTEHSAESGFTCYREYFTIREWNSTGEIISRLCDADNQRSVVMKSVTNQVVVRYSSSNYRYRRVSSFTLVYRQTLGVNQGCGGIKNTTTGQVRSPDIDQDGKYENDLDCAWKIIGGDNKIINLTFTSFNIEEPLNGVCIYDYVEVRDGIYSGDPVIGRYCGSTTPPPIVSSKNRMTLFFHSDSKVNKPGFVATYTSVPERCGTLSYEVTNVTQTLSSPGYPSSYPANIWCRWRIHTTYEYDRVQLNFTDLDVPCAGGNFVEISTPREVSQSYRVCRNATTHLHEIITTGSIFVSFHTGPSASAQGRGFQLQYAFQDCNLTLTKNNGLILSPRYPSKYLYSAHRYCVITVETSIGRTISLYFGRFLLQGSRGAPTTDCSSASLKVYDGEVSSNSLAELCGSAVPNPIFSTGNKLTLVLNSTYYMNTLYSISYTTTDNGRGCGGKLSHVNGTFTSPLYPAAYSQSSSCIWNLLVPSFHTMTLNFSFFELSSVGGCETNYLEVYEGNTQEMTNRIYRLCGDDSPGTINSQGNELLVKLVTDHTNTAPGFVAHFEMNSLVNAQTPDVLQVHQARMASSVVT